MGVVLKQPSTRTHLAVQQRDPQPPALSSSFPWRQRRRRRWHRVRHVRRETHIHGDQLRHAIGGAQHGASGLAADHSTEHGGADGGGEGTDGGPRRGDAVVCREDEQGGATHMGREAALRRRQAAGQRLQRACACVVLGLCAWARCGTLGTRQEAQGGKHGAQMGSGDSAEH